MRNVDSVQVVEKPLRLKGRLSREETSYSSVLFGCQGEWARAEAGLFAGKMVLIEG